MCSGKVCEYLWEIFREITCSSGPAKHLQLEWTSTKLCTTWCDSRVETPFHGAFVLWLLLAVFLQAVKVNSFGKWKTALQMTSMSLLLFCKDGTGRVHDMFAGEMNTAAAAAALILRNQVARLQCMQRQALDMHCLPQQVVSCCAFINNNQALVALLW
jgi:hypothetical protein